jgi:glycine cleavage system H protein
MSELPAELKYAETHEWARLEENDVVTVGITDHAQDQLGDVVYVELPEMGAELLAAAEAGIVESVKAASDVYAPVSGTVVEINSTLEEAPEKVNQDPYGDGWFYRIEASDTAELQDLMDADRYAELYEQEDSEEHDA